MNIVLLRFYTYPNPHYDNLAMSLRTRGHIVWVGTLNPETGFEWHDGRYVVAVQSGPAQVPGGLGRWHAASAAYRRIAFWRFIGRIRKFLRVTRPDMVQVDPSCMYWVWLLPLFMPNQIHFILDFCQLLQRADTGMLARLRNALDNWGRRICVRHIYHMGSFFSPDGAKLIMGEGWSRSARIIPTGVDAHFLSIRAATTSVPDEEPVRFIYLGVLSRVRQLERVLEAIQMALATSDRFEVTFIGPDAAEGFYHHLARQLGLTAQVTIKPPVPHSQVPMVCQRYHVALAYVPDLPPDWQDYPTLKALEYRALGLPIIASDFKGNQQIVQQGVNGLLVPNTAAAWAEAMTTFALDRAFLDTCRAHARQMRQGTTWDDVARIWEENVYSHIISRPSSPTAHHRVAH